MNRFEFERPLPLTRKDAALADAYALRYPGLGISRGRMAWRGRREYERGRITQREVDHAPAKIERLRRAEMTFSYFQIVEGRRVRDETRLYA